MLRVPVLSPSGKPLMPTKASRVKRWLKQGKAKVVHNDLNVFCVQLLVEPSNTKTQPIAVGIDPGKLYTGMAVQSPKCTLLMLHLYLPFKTIKDRMKQRQMARRRRRCRRINRKLPYSKRAHRQKRFSNRRKKRLSPSIHANKSLEMRVFTELLRLYPISDVVVEVVKARGDKGFSPVMVGQNYFLGWVRFFENWMWNIKVHCLEGWQTSQIRQHLGLSKQKHDKSEAIPATHAHDAIAVAASIWLKYGITSLNSMDWKGEIKVTPAQFVIVRRPPISRRQLHLMVPAKGGVRRKHGGTVTRHGFRKGDYVEVTQNNKTIRGWVSGDTNKCVSVSDAEWNRLGRFAAKKVRLLQRSTGLIVKAA